MKKLPSLLVPSTSTLTRHVGASSSSVSRVLSPLLSTKSRGDRLIASGRPHSTGGTVSVSGDHGISPSLISTVSKKVCELTMIFEGREGKEYYYGQGGLIRGDKIAQPPTRSTESVDSSEFTTSYEATPVTYAPWPSKGDAEMYSRTFDALVYTPYGGRTKCIKFRGETDDAAEFRPAWCDISYGSKITDPKSFFTKKERLFVKAPDTFRVEVGHKIGMAALRTTFENSHEDTCAPISVKLSDIYGPEDQACIYTGEVTEVSECGEEFSHNINNPRGCHGAVIFLLDQDQDVPKEVADGMAVGVHVGGMAELGLKNLAYGLK